MIEAEKQIEGAARESAVQRLLNGTNCSMQVSNADLQLPALAKILHRQFRRIDVLILIKAAQEINDYLSEHLKNETTKLFHRYGHPGC